MLKINNDFKLPKEVFSQKVDLNLLAQANHVYQDRSHVGLRNTKTRSEVNRTTKKVYKQKGTGGARHGSRRANVFVGGGVVFGPRALRRVLVLSQSIRNAAKIAAFSAKSIAKEITVVDGIAETKKTADFSKFLKTLRAKRFTVFLADKNIKSFKLLRNIKNVSTVLYKNASAFNIINGGFLILDQDIFEIKKVAKK